MTESPLGPPSRVATAVLTPVPPPATRPLRVAVIADGDLSDPATNSGVARELTVALAADPAIDLIALSGRLPRWQRAAVALTHLRVTRAAWRRAALKSRATVVLRSRLRDAQLDRLAVEPDIVLHVRNLYLPCRLPYACFVDTTAALSQGGWPGWRLPARLARWRARAETAFLGGAARVLTTGREVADSATADAGVPADRVDIVGGGTRVLPPPRGAVRRRPHEAVFIGLEWHRKGGDVLLEAWAAVVAAHPDAVLHLVGSGPAAGGPLPDGVVPHGRVSDRSALSAILAGASVFCLPARFEPYGLVVQEAMASGLAVVVSDVGELPYLVDSGRAGLVVPPEDPAALAAALLRLFGDDRLRAELSGRGRAAAAGMSWAAVAGRVAASLAAAT